MVSCLFQRLGGMTPKSLKPEFFSFVVSEVMPFCVILPDSREGERGKKKERKKRSSLSDLLKL